MNRSFIRKWKKKSHLVYTFIRNYAIINFQQNVPPIFSIHLYFYSFFVGNGHIKPLLAIFCIKFNIIFNQNWYQLPNPKMLGNVWAFQMRYQPVFQYLPWQLPHHTGRLNVVPFSYQSNIAYFTTFQSRNTTIRPNQGFMQ